MAGCPPTIGRPAAYGRVVLCGFTRARSGRPGPGGLGVSRGNGHGQGDADRRCRIITAVPANVPFNERFPRSRRRDSYFIIVYTYSARYIDSHRDGKMCPSVQQRRFYARVYLLKIKSHANSY